MAEADAARADRLHERVLLRSRRHPARRLPQCTPVAGRALQWSGRISLCSNAGADRPLLRRPVRPNRAPTGHPLWPSWNRHLRRALRPQQHVLLHGAVPLLGRPPQWQLSRHQDELGMFRTM
jgi:hypothetical protein